LFNSINNSGNTTIKGILSLVNYANAAQVLNFNIANVQASAQTTNFKINVTNIATNFTDPFSDATSVVFKIEQAGSQGQKGQKGEVGDKGIIGSTGAKGDTGSTGSTGSKGDKGQKGERISYATYNTSGGYHDFYNTDGSSFFISGLVGQTGATGEKGSSTAEGAATIAKDDSAMYPGAATANPVRPWYMSTYQYETLLGGASVGGVATRIGRNKVGLKQYWPFSYALRQGFINGDASYGGGANTTNEKTGIHWYKKYYALTTPSYSYAASIQDARYVITQDEPLIDYTPVSLSESTTYGASRDTEPVEITDRITTQVGYYGNVAGVFSYSGGAVIEAFHGFTGGGGTFGVTTNTYQFAKTLTPGMYFLQVLYKKGSDKMSVGQIPTSNITGDRAKIWFTPVGAPANTTAVTSLKTIKISGTTSAPAAFATNQPLMIGIPTTSYFEYTQRGYYNPYSFFYPERIFTSAGNRNNINPSSTKYQAGSIDQMSISYANVAYYSNSVFVSNIDTAYFNNSPSNNNLAYLTNLKEVKQANIASGTGTTADPYIVQPNFVSTTATLHDTISYDSNTMHVATIYVSSNTSFDLNANLFMNSYSSSPNTAYNGTSNDFIGVSVSRVGTSGLQPIVQRAVPILYTTGPYGDKSPFVIRGLYGKSIVLVPATRQISVYVTGNTIGGTGGLVSDVTSTLVPYSAERAVVSGAGTQADPWILTGKRNTTYGYQAFAIKSANTSTGANSWTVPYNLVFDPILDESTDQAVPMLYAPDTLGLDYNNNGGGLMYPNYLNQWMVYDSLTYKDSNMSYGGMHSYGSGINESGLAPVLLDNCYGSPFVRYVSEGSSYHVKGRMAASNPQYNFAYFYHRLAGIAHFARDKKWLGGHNGGTIRPWTIDFTFGLSDYMKECQSVNLLNMYDTASQGISIKYNKSANDKSISIDIYNEAGTPAALATIKIPFLFDVGDNGYGSLWNASGGEGQGYAYKTNKLLICYNPFDPNARLRVILNNIEVYSGLTTELKVGYSRIFIGNHGIENETAAAAGFIGHAALDIMPIDVAKRGITSSFSNVMISGGLSHAYNDTNANGSIRLTGNTYINSYINAAGYPLPAYEMRLFKPATTSAANAESSGFYDVAVGSLITTATTTAESNTIPRGSYITNVDWDPAANITLTKAQTIAGNSYVYAINAGDDIKSNTTVVDTFNYNDNAYAANVGGVANLVGGFYVASPGYYKVISGGTGLISANAMTYFPAKGYYYKFRMQDSYVNSALTYSYSLTGGYEYNLYPDSLALANSGPGQSNVANTITLQKLSYVDVASYTGFESSANSSTTTVYISSSVNPSNGALSANVDPTSLPLVANALTFGGYLANGYVVIEDTAANRRKMRAVRVGGIMSNAVAGYDISRANNAVGKAQETYIASISWIPDVTAIATVGGTTPPANFSNSTNSPYTAVNPTAKPGFVIQVNGPNTALSNATYNATAWRYTLGHIDYMIYDALNNSSDQSLFYKPELSSGVSCAIDGFNHNYGRFQQHFGLTYGKRTFTFGSASSNNQSRYAITSSYGNIKSNYYFAGEYIAASYSNIIGVAGELITGGLGGGIISWRPTPVNMTYDSGMFRATATTKTINMYFPFAAMDYKILDYGAVSGGAPNFISGSASAGTGRSLVVYNGGATATVGAGIPMAQQFTVTGSGLAISNLTVGNYYRIIITPITTGF